ncbi:MAG: excinuclease ABC subunit UvrA [Alphaproteobacteria bacterium]|nr:excinuclease ABC subunit UvrA [Alphaproteobacteria bacterium]
MVKYIEVKGAKEHNLKNIDVKIPKNSITVITGVSGSGKSSLAFDTIYAEGYRRFVESLSAYARQILNINSKPDVESITGLSPAIAIEQKSISSNSRSIVGTVTEVYDFLRLLYTTVGVPHCPIHGNAIDAQTTGQIVKEVLEYPEKSRIHILAPVIRNKKGRHITLLKDLKKKGFTRFKIDNEIYLVEELPKLNAKLEHDIAIVIDRLLVKAENKERLADSVGYALDNGKDLVTIDVVSKDGAVESSKLFSSKFLCPECGYTMPKLEPRMFSFNSPLGACDKCNGIGEIGFFSEELVFENTEMPMIYQKGRKTLSALRPWLNLDDLQYDILRSLAKVNKVTKTDLENKAIKKLPEKFIKELLHGREHPLRLTQAYKGKSIKYKGVMPKLEETWKKAGPHKKAYLWSFRDMRSCEKCNGSRLKNEVLNVKVEGKSISDLCRLDIVSLKKFADKLEGKLKGKNSVIAKPILKEVISRLGFLDQVGVGYLTLDRKSFTLSGGESQRIRLASQIGSGLNGVLYVLDEPSIGLHQRDNHRLLESLQNLKKLDNTIIVVEHDEDAMKQADYIVDVGPAAGIYGGEIVAAGTPKQVMNNSKSLTGRYLTGKEEISVPNKRRKLDKKKLLTIKGASENNLKNVNADFPIGLLTCVTGVSGSGKSTLVIDTLYKALNHKLQGRSFNIGKHKELKGYEHIDKIVELDQSPIGRTPRSNPATYTGIMTPLRDWFSALPESKVRGYNQAWFSFNVRRGACQACNGDGLIKIEMHFLADVYVECDECKGKRYNSEVLEVKYKGKSIADVLALSVEEALGFFSEVPKIKNKLQVLKDVGLSYIKLGQSATTLSGGEAQRMKIAKELSKRSTGKTLYILDEPTTGLHFEDIKILLKVLHRLVGEGNTMIIIEHNLDVVKTSDFVIDVGPDGGDKGGKIVAKGTPEEVAKVKESYTGQYLKKMLK